MFEPYFSIDMRYTGILQRCLSSWQTLGFQYLFFLNCLIFSLFFVIGTKRKKKKKSGSRLTSIRLYKLNAFTILKMKDAQSKDIISVTQNFFSLIYFLLACLIIILFVFYFKFYFIFSYVNYMM